MADKHSPDDPDKSVGSPSDESEGSAVRYIADETVELLKHRQSVLYTQTIRDFVEWMQTQGKNPKKSTGLSTHCTANYARRVDQLYRYVWQEVEQSIVLEIDHWHADQINQALVDDELRKRDGGCYSKTSKRKFNDTLRKYFEWRAHTGTGQKWHPPVEFNDNNSQAPDEFTIRERKELREASIEFKTLPAYSDCSPEQRGELKGYLAQKLGKPIEKVTPDDWRQHNRSWEIASLVWAALDGGFRPIEITRAEVTWARTQKATLSIPKEDSAKGEQNWEVALTRQTAEILHRWLDQRSHLERYSNSDKLWLTQHGNPWSSSSLNYLLDNLLDATNIDTQHRRLSWYSIRHSVGEYLTEEGDLTKAQTQLRHESLETTKQYRDPSPESRRDSLDKIG